MKICIGKKEKISRFFDGDLSVDERKEMSDHILECKSCASVYKSYLRIKQFSNALYSGEQHRSYLDMILQDSHVHKEPRHFPLVFVLPGSVFTAVLLVIVMLSTFNLHKTRYDLPVLIENSASIMDMPLGALAYYEEYSGKTVQSQFVNFSSELSKSAYLSQSDSLTYQTYSSPIFYDNNWNTAETK